MRIYLLTILSFIFFFSVKARTKIVGYVTIQNSNHKSAWPCVVKAYGAATDVQIDKTTGRFEIIFDNKRSGDDVELEVSKYGYEVVNKDDLFARIPIDADSQAPLSFFICRKGEWRENADKLFNINLAAINKQYKARLELLKSDYKDRANALKAKILQLDLERECVIRQAESFSEFLAKTNFDDASVKLRKAYNYLKEGEFDSVLSVLVESKIVADINRFKADSLVGDSIVQLGKAKIASAQTALKNSYQELLVLAQTYAQKSDWLNAEREYLLLTSYPVGTDIYFEAASFFSNRGKYSIALSILKKISEDRIPIAKGFMISRLITKVKIQTNEIKDAKELVENDLAFMYSYSDTSAIEAKKNIAALLNDLGMIYLNYQNADSAIEVLNKSAELYRLIGYSYQAAHALFNVAQAYDYRGNKQRAIYFYKQALKELYASTADNYSIQDLKGVILFKMAESLTDVYDFKQARDSSLKAVETFEYLYQMDSAKYGFKLANSIERYASVMEQSKSLEDAHFYYLKEVEILRRLVNQDPNFYKPKLAEALFLLSGLYTYAKTDSAKMLIKEGCSIYEGFIANNPQQYLSRSLFFLRQLADVYSFSGVYDTAILYYDSCISIARRLYAKNKIANGLILYNALLNLGVTQEHRNLYADAKKLYLEANSVIIGLSQEDSVAYADEIKVSEQNLGNVCYSMKNYKESQFYFMKALDRTEKLYRKSPKSYGREYAMALISMGNVSKMLKKYSNSESYYIDVIKLCDLNTVYMPNIKMVALFNLGGLYMNQFAKSNDVKWSQKAQALIPVMQMTLNGLPFYDINKKAFFDLFFKYKDCAVNNICE